MDWSSLVSYLDIMDRLDSFALSQHPDVLHHKIFLSIANHMDVLIALETTESYIPDSSHSPNYCSVT